MYYILQNAWLDAAFLIIDYSEHRIKMTKTYLIPRQGPDCLHHCQSYQVLKEGNSLPQWGLHWDPDMQCEQGTPQRT